MKVISGYSSISTHVLSGAEAFWDKPDIPTDTHEMLRFSFFMGLFPFAGFLFHYTVTGRVWNDWPFVNSTLPVLRGLMCAGLQWVLYGIFPTISTILLELILSKRPTPPDPRDLTVVSTYSMVPMHISALFVGTVVLMRTSVVIGFSLFLYLLFFGYRRYLKLSVWRSVLMTFLLISLFGLIRQMFVFVIGF